MNTKRFMAVFVCVLMLAAFTACNTNTSSTDIPSPPTDTVQLQDATGSVLIGDWTVEAVVSKFNEISFHQDGSLAVNNNGHTLGGVFTDDGTTVTITISGQTLSGAYVVDGDKITINADNDTLVLTKK